MGFFKASKKMVAAANYSFFSSVGRIDCFNTGFSIGTIHLRNILTFIKKGDLIALFILNHFFYFKYSILLQL